MIAAGEAGRAIERYDIYLIPLAAIAFFAYVERGAPWLRLYVGLALAGSATAWLMPFPARAGTAFTFDSPTFSTYAQLATWFGNANAATIFAAIPFLGGIALALLPLRRRLAPVAVCGATIAVLLLSGIPAYAGDHAVTRGTLHLRAGDPPDWLDRSGLGPADYLQLPGGSAHYGWLLEAWNRDFRHPIQMGLPSYDGYVSSTARIDRDGRLLVDGHPPDAGILVVNDVATAIEIEGSRVVAQPSRRSHGLPAAGGPAGSLPGAGPRLRPLGCLGRELSGLAAEQIAQRALPGRSCATRADTRARRVTFESDGSVDRTIRLQPGERTSVRIPVRGYPVPVLRIRTDTADYVGGGTPNARFLAVRIPAISYVSRGQNSDSRTCLGLPIARSRDCHA